MTEAALRVDTLPDDVTNRAEVIYPFAGSDRGRDRERERQRKRESERERETPSKPAVGGRVFQPPISDAIPSLPGWRRRRLERPFCTISLPRKRLLDPPPPPSLSSRRLAEQQPVIAAP